MLKKEQWIMLFFVMLVFAFSSLYISKQTNAITQSAQKVVHQAHLSDSWYPHDPAALHEEINSYLTTAHQDLLVTTDPNLVRALIVPHAGHFYSGLCAAAAYQTLREYVAGQPTKNLAITRVVILAPSHTTYFQGVALPDYTAYQTPLGMIDVDQKAVMQLAAHSYFSFNSQAHAREHAVEIQLPFLQETIASFKIVPLIVGVLNDDSLASIRSALRTLIDQQTLLVISSDFMHHGPQFNYAMFSNNIGSCIQYVDSSAIRAITTPSLNDFQDLLNRTGTTICGQNPIKIFLSLCEHQDVGSLSAHLACYYTSAQLQQAWDGTQINGTKLFESAPDAVAAESVSYVGLVFGRPAPVRAENVLTVYEKKALLRSARQVIANALAPADTQVEEHLLWPPLSPAMLRNTGAFVTLNTKDGNLRGCIGQIIPTGPLFKTVTEMAKAAALRDRRFSPVTASELDDLVIDITLLSPPHPVHSVDEIEIGRHGIILKKLNPDGSQRATSVFLPQVPGSFGWTREETLGHLSTKAGLAPDAWKEDCLFEVFEGFEIHE
jgi:AmmeMemoRadiSam system protein B/AmmeMemoRadiSam system protein A